MKIKITADSTVDLSEELVKEYDMAIMPLWVTLGDETKLDGIEISTNDLFEYVDKTGELPKTASPSIASYQEFYDEQLKQADCIIHFVVSGMLSSCYNNALKAAEEYGEKVYVVDSRSLSTGIALLALYACDRAKEGVEPAKIVEECKLLTKKVQASFVLGDLNYMHKGGRCSGAMRLSAKFLRMKPEIILSNGEMKVGKKFMGKLDKVVENYVDETLAKYPEYDRKRVFITHTPIDKTICEQVKEKFKGKFDNIYETNAGATIASHCGLDTLGILFIAK